MRLLSDDAGGQNKKVHNFIWPVGVWKGRRLVSLPLEYLRKFVQNPTHKRSKQLYKLAQLEIKRRNVGRGNIHITEHAMERFTQRWSDLVYRYQRRFYPGKEVPGAVTIMKDAFEKALNSGSTIGAEGNSGNNYSVRWKKFRWIYGVYNHPNKPLEYRVISVTPANYKRKSKRTSG